MSSLRESRFGMHSVLGDKDLAATNQYAMTRHIIDSSTGLPIRPACPSLLGIWVDTRMGSCMESVVQSAFIEYAHSVKALSWDCSLRTSARLDPYRHQRRGCIPASRKLSDLFGILHAAAARHGMLRTGIFLTKSPLLRKSGAENPESMVGKILV
jgi:hypothetical protein